MTMSAEATLLGGSRSVVVKVGSSLIIGERADSDTDACVRQQWLQSLAADIAALSHAGARVVVVTSGAVALGQPALGIARNDMQLAHKQAAAAAGQVLLLQAWKDALAAQGVDVAGLDFEASYGRTSMEYYDGFVFGFYAESRPD